MTDHPSFTDHQVKSIIDRIENLEAQIKELNADKSEVYQEAKACGFDVAILKKLVAERRKGASERAEEEAILELYREALERASRARTRDAA